MISKTTKLTSVAVLTLAISLGAIFGISPARALTDLNDIKAGDLIRGESFSAVYYMGADGFRYVFPNDKTYFTWYDNFDDVIWISDSDLAKIQIGGNVTYKPDVKMIKITSDPKTYYVGEGGALYWVPSEEVATALYGSDWNTKIDDVPDSFFTNYTITGEEATAYIRPTSDIYNTYTINDDKNLVAPEEISITSDGYSPISVNIEAGQTVKFINNDSEKHTASAEDLTWGTGTISPGNSYVQRFDEPGTYTFFDSYDSGNTGAIYVE